MTLILTVAIGNSRNSRKRVSYIVYLSEEHPSSPQQYEGVIRFRSKILQHIIKTKYSNKLLDGFSPYKSTN